MYDIQHCFICRPSNFSVPEDAGIDKYDTDASINNTQEYTLLYVFVRSANSELNYKSA
jgi:hypothetical protein